MSGGYGSGGGGDYTKIDAIQAELDKAKGVMKQNIDKTINRGQQLDQLGDKADTLSNRATTFQTQARNARRQMCFNNYRNLAIVAIVLIVIPFTSLSSSCSDLYLELTIAMLSVIFS